MSARALAPATVPQTYAELRRRVEQVVFTGRRQIERAWLQTYHDTGRLIHEHLLLNKQRADYGAQVFTRLATDTGISKRTLHECAQLYRCFPIVRLTAQLTRTHYVLLCQVEDATDRAKLTAQAMKSNWTVAQLTEHVRALNSSADDDPADSAAPAPVSAVTLLKPKRGTPGFYPVVTRTDGPALDLGFKVYLPLAFRPEPSLQKLAAGAIVQADADHAPASAPDATKADLYTYRTTAVRVVDGDTLAVTIDLPPFNRLDKKLRLRGLNCPELNTDAGQVAKRYVQALVDRCSEVIITTTKPDKYDRYLADVFLLGIDDGAKVDAGDSSLVTSHSSLFLNNALLADRQAVPMGDDAQPVVV